MIDFTQWIPKLFFVDTYKRFPPTIKHKLGNIFDDRSGYSLKILHDMSTSKSRQLNHPHSVEANTTISTQYSQDILSTNNPAIQASPDSKGLRYRPHFSSLLFFDYSLLSNPLLLSPV
jgi:hypothetical protein